MKKHIIFCLFFTLLNVYLNAQCKVITYSHNLNFNSPDAKHHIYKSIWFNKNKGLSYNAPVSIVKLNPNQAEKKNFINYSVTLLDKKVNSFNYFQYSLDTISNKSSFNFNNQNWSSIDGYLNPKIDNNFKIENVNGDTKRNFKIKKQKDVKVISGYECNLLHVSEYGRNYNVWYTNDFNYNWLFLNFVYELPGTVILIEEDGKTVLELVSVEELNYDQTDIKTKDLLKILCTWGNE